MNKDILIFIYCFFITDANTYKIQFKDKTDN